MEEEGKGRHLIYREHQCFRQFQSFGRDTGRRKKGSGSYHKDASRQQDFFFECAENTKVFGTFMMLERMRGGERKEEVLKPKCTDESMVAAGFTFLDILEMLGGFDAFIGRDVGDRGKGRGSGLGLCP